MIEHINSPSPLSEGGTLRPVSVPGCLRAVGLMFGTKMVLDRHWLSLDGVNRNRTATMLIVQAPAGWRQSLARLRTLRGAYSVWTSRTRAASAAWYEPITSTYCNFLRLYIY